MPGWHSIRVWKQSRLFRFTVFAIALRGVAGLGLGFYFGLCLCLYVGLCISLRFGSGLSLYLSLGVRAAFGVFILLFVRERVLIT